MTTKVTVSGMRLGLLASALSVACTGGGVDPTPTAGHGASAPGARISVPAPVDRASFSAYQSAKPVNAAPAPAMVVSADRRASARVTSIDSQRQVPTFVWAPRVAPPRAAAPLADAVIARHHLRQFASMYHLDTADLDRTVMKRMHDTGRGALIATFEQKVAGLEVYGQTAKVVMARDRSLVAIAGTLKERTVRDEVSVANGFTLSPAEAIDFALEDLYGIVFTDALLPAGPDLAGNQRFSLTGDFDVAGTGYRFVTPARARAVAYALPDRLVSAYLLEVDAAPAGAGSADMYRYVIAADDGRVLERHNLTAYDTYQFRVFADDDLRPTDGPIEDVTPHPTGIDDGYEAAFAAPRMVSVTDGLNSMADPWLPTDATETLGNNVDAYADHASPDGFGAGDVRGATTAPGVFDYTFDTDIGPFDTDNNVQAAVVQLFYVNNWLHDYYYDSGFDEAAGNAQEDNFGRGGAGGDPLHAEAQDTKGDQRNNANMSTPGDGASPRMQMYVFTGDDDTSIEVTSPASIAGTYDAVRGSIGSDTDVALSGNLVFVVDNDGTATACSGITNDVTGAIAVIDRGDCTFAEKAQAAQDGGATGVVLINNAPGAAISAGGNAPNLTIPVVMIRQADGDAIRAEATNAIAGAVSSIAGVLRDGTIDNHISTHEWGHYIHNRLVSVGSTQTSGQGEGWGDFFALMLAIRPGDDLDGTYAMGPYATSNAYQGIRRYPYSNDMDKNGLTFRHITDGESLPGGTPGRNNFEVHNAGEVWCSMMFDAYISLLRQSEGSSPRYTFEEARRRMADYVVAGMKAAPFAPTFTEQRDAILAAAAASDMTDFEAMAAAFARRGAGSGAISPPRSSQDGSGVVESFVLAGALSVSQGDLAEADGSCDGDGVVDAGERGTVTVTVTNTGAGTLDTPVATVSSTSTGVTFPAGTSFDLPAMPPFASEEVEIEVELDDFFAGRRLDLDITVSDPDAVVTSVVSSAFAQVNFDEKPQSTNLETVGGRDVEMVWDIDTDGVGPWRRSIDPDNGNAVWLVPDNGALSDERLVTPALEVSTGADFVVRFDHRYSFEESQGTLWDGGLLELSTDGGTTWVDVSDYVDPGYTGELGSDADNPLGGRPGWGGQSAGFDNGTFVNVSLDFGQQLAGETVLLRFRMGTDQNSGDAGWELDNLRFTGIDNTPFTEVTDDLGACRPNQPPVADAGDDRRAGVSAPVTLDGTGSSDPDGDPLTYQWSQVSGPDAVLDDATSPTPTFRAPVVTSDEAIVFELVVSDGRAQSSADQVVITVVARSDDNPGDGEGGGCGCNGGGSSPAGGAVLALIAVFGLRRRRRIA